MKLHFMKQLIFTNFFQFFFKLSREILLILKTEVHNSN